MLVTHRLGWEPRADKRADILGTPQFTDDYTGELLGSWVLVEAGVSQLAPFLERGLDADLEVQDEGQHFAPFVPESAIRRRRCTRSAGACRPSRRHSSTGWVPRIRPMPVSSSCSRCVQAIVAALLQADTTLSQRGLIRAAGVTPGTVRNHRDVLEALGLLAVDEGANTHAYRLHLPFREERRDEGRPRPGARGVWTLWKQWNSRTSIPGEHWEP